MRIAELRETCRYWQTELGLTDWRIHLRFPKAGEISQEYAGHTYWKPEYPEGLIIVDRSAGAHTIVHELLHIRLEGHRIACKRYDPLYERALNCLAEALLKDPEPGELTS